MSKKKTLTMDLYQAHNGSIQLLSQLGNTALTDEQIKALRIDLFSIEDFLSHDYESYYQIPKKEIKTAKFDN